MFSEIQPKCGRQKQARVFMWWKQTAQGVCFRPKQQPNSWEHEGWCGWQCSKTHLLWLMWPSTQCIGKDIKGSSLSTWREADVISEAIFTAVTRDCDDKLAGMDLSMIAVALTPSWLVWILTIMPVWLYFSSFLFFFSAFFWTPKNMVFKW